MTAAASHLAPSPSAPRVLVETSRALPLVSITISERSGAIDDPPGKEGLARFAVRLMRRTGGGLTPQEVDTRIDSLGGALGADASQSTAGFHGTVISRSLEPFVDLLIDVLARPGFSADEHGRLQREIQSDLVELRDNDRALAQRWFRCKLFADHAYGRSSGGTIASVSAIAPEDVKAQHARSMCSDNLVFAFAGDIDADGATRVAERIVAALPRGARSGDALGDPRPVPGRRLVFVDKPERTQTQILIGGLGTHPRDADHVALHVANTVFGGTFTARMTREIRSKRGWSYGAYSNLPYDRHRQAFSMWTFPKAEDAAACVRLEIELLEAWRDRGISARELAWAQRYLTRSHAFAIDTAQKRVGLALDEEIYDLPAGYYADYIDHTNAVTLEQANQAVRDRISTDDLLVVVVGTASEIGDALRDAIPNLARSEVVPFDRDV
jgi:zinc protease